MTRAAWLLVLALGVAGCGGQSAPPPPPAVMAEDPEPVEIPVVPTFQPPEPAMEEPALDPEDTLAAWITAQESGDFGWAVSFVAADQQQAFAEAVEEMSRDDLVASGLQFRDEAYALEFADDRLAVFWSAPAKLYLVMVREEDGKWRLDPARTDEMNAQRAATEAGDAGS